MMKKRILSVLAACLMVLPLAAIPVSAKNGDIAGAVYYTDIRAYINSHPIESYNVDGYMCRGSGGLRFFSVLVCGITAAECCALSRI